MTAGNGNGRKQRLELTWIGKDQRPRLEPRVLLPVAEQSYARGSPDDGGIYDNILIQGDNLLALKALEQQFAGKVKCIYIDPPFNTAQALDYYDDGLEHSIWLSLIRERLEALHRLLSDDGTLFIHIDDNELGYLIALADEVFGRSNRAYVVTFRQASATGHKSINPGCVKITNFVLIYAKDKGRWAPKRVFTSRERDKRYNQFILNRDASYRMWTVVPLVEAFAQRRGIELKEARALVKSDASTLDQFVLENANSVIQWARPDYDAIGKEVKALIDASEADPDGWYHLPRDDHPDFYVRAGQRALFYSNKLKQVDGKYVSGEPLTTLWDDILSNNLHKEGGVDFPKGKKPEALIKRCLELSTEAGDLVLDSFAGSGTTGAVAHKMGRRWIMIELGEHATTHIVPRLKKVIDGQDPGGVTEAAGWKGGGGFRFYRLAPSLIETDQFGQKVISKHYNAAMLAEAMCKHMGFTYAPSQDPALYWQQGYSSERDFIYTTTQSLTHEALKALSLEVGDGRTLLICCKAFRARLSDFPNLTVRKIPQAVLDNCEWGRDDYSLNIAKPSQDTGDDPDYSPGGDEDNGGGPEPARRGRPRRTTAAEPEVRAAPVRKPPLKMDGTTRAPRLKKVPSTQVVQTEPVITPVKAPVAATRNSTSRTKPAKKAKAVKPPAVPAKPANSGTSGKRAKPKVATKRKSAGKPKRIRHVDDRQGRLL